MKCSKCSAVIRPVVAIDIDGTLGDYHGHFLEFAAGWLGVRPGPAVPMWEGAAAEGQGFSDWFCFAFQVERTTFRAIKLAYRQGGMKRSMPVYDHAVAFVRSLQARGAEVWLTTTRPHDRFDRVDPDTREWLRRNGIPFDGLLYDDRKMEALAERVERERVAFVLDDLPETLARAAREFPAAGTFLRRTRWNCRANWPLIVDSLLDARAVATAHIQDWGLTHAFDDLPTTTEEQK